MITKERVAAAVGIIAIVTFFYGIGKYVDFRYAHRITMEAIAQETKQEMKKVSDRLEYKIIDDQSKSIDERIFIIEERCKKRPCTDTEKEELMKLKKQQVILEKKMDFMMKEAK